MSNLTEKQHSKRMKKKNRTKSHGVGKLVRFVNPKLKVRDTDKKEQNAVIEDNNYRKQNAVIEDKNYRKPKMGIHSKTKDESATIVRNGEGEKTTRKEETTTIQVQKATKFGLDLFEASGISHAKVLGKLARESTLFKIKSQGRKLQFYAPSKDRAKIIAILESVCYNYLIIKTVGALPALARTVKRAGLMLGIVTAVVALVCYSRFVISIESGGILDKDVAEIIAASGVREGAFVWNLDEDSLAKELRSLDGVVFADVTRRGTRVYVNVKRELPREEYFVPSATPPVAMKNATITRITVYGGTAVVEVGDEVKAGDSLIEPYLIVGEEKVPARADGEVYGEVCYEWTQFFPDTVLTVETGAIKEYTRLSIFGSKVKPPTSPFESCQTYYEVKKSDFFLPYTIHRWRFVELNTVEGQNTLGENEMRSRTLSSLIGNLPTGATVLRSEVTLGRIEGGTTVQALVAVEERVDRK